VIPEQSTSGRWAKGQLYSPPSGPCAGHVVEVINPEVELVSFYLVERGAVVGRSEPEPQTAVLVRCRDCKLSWSFPEALELPDD
jgi:hypothetical protein